MQIRWVLNAVDVALVILFLYYIFVWLRGTQAINLLRGLFFLAVIYAAAKLLNLFIVEWLFEKFAAVILVTIVIVFQPELRRTLEQIGRRRFLGRLGLAPLTSSWFIRSLVRAVETLSEDRLGALLVLEGNTGLNEYIESGTRLDALVSSELLLSIFEKRSPLHDGAVIIRGGRIVAAGCLLPLSESKLLDKRLGTRHRAGVGLSEMTDALVIAVSETTGTISFAENGYLTRFVTREMLEEKLFGMFREQFPKMEFRWPWAKKRK